MRIFVVVFSLLFVSKANSICTGMFPNPINICWRCIFPVTIAGVPLGASPDAPPNEFQLPVCFCADPVPRPGIPISFYEPVRLVDVVKDPFCMVNLGGLPFATKIGIHGKGTHNKTSKGTTKRGFMHVHWYVFPLMYLLELFADFVCMEMATPDIAYVTELDPSWNHDSISMFLNPEAALFGNPIAWGACVGECALATAGFPMDSLFWCAGCWGNLYPFNGNVAAVKSGIQASQLLVARFMAKLHRQGMLWGYIGESGLCGRYPMPIIRKNQYKTQMMFPIPSLLSCDPIGRTDVLWSIGRNIIGLENYGYMVWRRRNCCLL